MEQEYARIDRENAQLEEALRKIEANKREMIWFLIFNVLVVVNLV